MNQGIRTALIVFLINGSFNMTDLSAVPVNKNGTFILISSRTIEERISCEIGLFIRTCSGNVLIMGLPLTKRSEFFKYAFVRVILLLFRICSCFVRWTLTGVSIAMPD